jgi:cytochrome c peroxidase
VKRYVAFVLSCMIPIASLGDEADMFLRRVIEAYRLEPYKPPQRVFGAKERLGQALFFDPIVSGPRRISCATCHVRSKGAGDGLPVAVALGGGEGVGQERVKNIDAFLIPRNAMPFFNRGSEDFVAFFWDGRVQRSQTGRIESPLGEYLPSGFDSLLAVAVAFPLAEQDEMLGRSYERKGSASTFHQELVTDDVDPDNYQERARRVFPKVIRRLTLAGPREEQSMRDNYVRLFRAAYPGTPVEKLGMAELGNALAAYISIAFDLRPAPWDKYLAGEIRALTSAQKRGALTFFGKGRCAVCHSGKQFSDFQFHGLAVPQLGVGKHGAHVDYGRAGATSRGEDRFRFRTPLLRNASKTGPWGHNGSFTDLKSVITHHYNPVPALWAAQQKFPEEAGRAGRLLGFRSPILSEMDPLSSSDVEEVIAFLSALNSETVMSDKEALPRSVPSGMNQFILK